MDSFTENILARARERQKLLNEYSDNEKGSPLRETNSEINLKSSSQNSLNEIKKLSRKQVVSDTQLMLSNDKVNTAIKENLSENNLSKFKRQTSKTRISTDMPGSPKPSLKTLNIQRDNINMEIKLTSSDNVRVEVEIEEKDESDNESIASDHSGLREDAKKRLNRLGQLYAGGDDAGISSPIHKSEAKFHEMHEEESVKKVSKTTESKSGRKGLSKLADLASHINEFEDDLTHMALTKESKSPSKKTWKHPAPQPPTENSPLKVKGKAPNPPKNNDPPKAASISSSPTKSSLSAPRVQGATPKQIKWDQTVLDTLENVNKKDETKKSKPETVREEPEKGSNKIAEIQANFNGGGKTPSSPTKCPRSPVKSKGVISGRAAFFESAANSPNKPTKDPALMSVSERMALFEKNKGAALVPKAAFGMSAPVSDAKQNTKPALAAKSGEKASGGKKYPAPKPPTVAQVHNPPTVAAVSQAGGIASKMAALLEGKSTISEGQISSGIKEQRQKEMDMLLNRFNKNKEVANVQEESSDEDEMDANEETAMLCERKSTKIVSSSMPPPPPAPEHIYVESRKSGGKRSSTSSDQIVTAVLDEVKRIKVSPPKHGKLYPNLSDIEASTETETQTQTSDDSRNSSFGNQYDSDDPNTSFGRDLLEAVCKNQTPQKRPIYDESTASDISSALEELDYLNDMVEDDIESSGPTPPKNLRQSQNCQAAPSHSFNYKSFTPNVKSPKSQFRSPMKVPSPRKSLEQQQYVMDGDNMVPLTHTVSFYRKQQTQQNKTPVRQVTRQALIEEDVEKTDKKQLKEVEKKIKELNDEVNKQQMIISQTSQALNLCNCTPEFSGSTEQVEAEKVLLVATHRRQACLHEIQRMKVEGTIRPQGEHAQNLPLEKGALTISNMVLPLKQKYVTALAATGGKGHHVVCLIKCGDQVVPTKLVSTVAGSKKNPEVDLYIPGTIILKNVYSDLTVTFEVYCLQAQEEFLPHEVKYHINNKKPSSKMTPKKSKQDRLQRPIKESPAGPQAVRSTSFSLMGYVVFSVQAVTKKHWSLNNTPSMSPLEGIVEMKITCDLAVSVEHRGFLTMFEDVSGFGAWHRRWCLLKGHTLSYWKYPDDEKKVAPIDTISLKNCVTKQVGPVSRDICARLHTFLLERERIAYPQDKETLVMVRKGERTIIRHLLSADTKEERIEWCSKFNAALAALRMWGNSEH
ncbi:unnamed protein product [Brassicogethes aeneus]|uniref:PH domain-containing protein n=1 Tax=Brassicogethes aeneus TaxID=1431903 RepID=A0A9P0AW08_BRAAE|nr:unnamed protein product [Brassicogethes aeneus]